MQASRVSAENSLSGIRVFIVEDESLVAMQLEDMLQDIGCEVACVAMRVGRALAMLEDCLPFDIAVLDVNINGEKVFPVAEKLRMQGVPVVFATGYGRSGLTPEWASRPVLQKPYTQAQLAEALDLALAQGETAAGVSATRPAHP